MMTPAGFIFAHAVLEVEDGIALGGILVIVRRSIDVGVAFGAGGLGVVIDLTQLAMGHFLEGVKVLVFGGNFDAAAPTTGAVEIEAAGIRNLGAIDNELIIVESLS